MVRPPPWAPWALALVCLCTARASAHPLGNFTINHLAVVAPHGRALRVHYVLDIAEIPAFQIMHAGNGWNGAAMQAWARDEAAVVLAGFSVTANATALAFQIDGVHAATRPGAGGLPTLYWTGDFSAALPALPAAIRIEDRVYADRRIGWKDIVLPGMSDPTGALRSYPSALVGSPRRNDRASFDLLAGGAIAHASAVADEDPAAWGAPSIVRSSLLSDLFARTDQTPLLVLLTVLAAFGLGALHGLEPGHGKALLAFTLVGARATFGQAAILAAALTFAHTIAVLLLGLVLFFAAGFASESLFAWITLASGAAVALIGARSLANALQRVLPHAHDGHRHTHGGGHAHGGGDGHGHSHAIAGTEKLHFPSAVVAAMSGGIAPCPAAIVVLLTALHLHRVGYGVFLIVAFSLGLAAILTGLGLAVVHGAAWLQSRRGFSRLAGIAPLVTASVISIIGAAMLAQGFADQGIHVPAAAVAGLTLLAIAGFALAPRHKHEGLQTA